jgi:hypothetical protein
MKYKILHQNYTKKQNKTLKLLKFQGFIFNNGADEGLIFNIYKLKKY